MKITVLGSGTSHGIPVIGCGCDVCASADPRDKRTRSSILIEHGPTVVLIDAGPDFRFQALRAGVRRLDALLMTHTHADHLHGLDDTRSLTYDRPLDVYGSASTIKEIRRRFDYIFTATQIGGGKPNIRLINHNGNKISVGDMPIVPVPVLHGDLTIFGYRVGNFAYITDCSYLPESSLKSLIGVKYLVINALRYRPHATHFNIEQAVEAAGRIGATRTWLTHLCHDMSHKKLTDELEISNNENRRISPAHDGLEIITDM